eukprot:gene4601-biopygen4542
MLLSESLVGYAPSSANRPENPLSPTESPSAKRAPPASREDLAYAVIAPPSGFTDLAPHLVDCSETRFRQDRELQEQPTLTHRRVLLPILHFLFGKDFESWVRLRASSCTVRDTCDEFTRWEQSPDLFCWGHDRLYISLQHTELPGAFGCTNTSSSFGWKGGSQSTTYWYKLRFDPCTAKVHTGDYTFSRNAVLRARQKVIRVGNPNFADCPGAAQELDGFHTVRLGEGDVLYVTVGESIPYGTCLDCSAPGSMCATANIDLRGTSWAVKSTFAHGGYLSAGVVDFDDRKQVVNMRGGGYCGWMASTDAVSRGAVDDLPGDWSLQLSPVGG